jgi:hypothetical protein
LEDLQATLPKQAFVIPRIVGVVLAAGRTQAVGIMGVGPIGAFIVWRHISVSVFIFGGIPLAVIFSLMSKLVGCASSI